jgi:hypothetical protein
LLSMMSRQSSKISMNQVGKKRKPHKNSKANLWVGMTVPRSFIRNPPDNQIYTFVQSIDVGTLTQSSTFINLSYAVNLSSLPQAASFGQVFDQYRIAEIEFIIRPFFTTGQSSMHTPLLYTVIDYDDNTALTGGNTTYLQYTNCVTTQYETLVRTFVPHVAVAALDNTGYNSSANETAPWLDMANSGVLHYGLKLGMDASGGGTPLQAFSIVQRLKFQVRNVR